MILDADCHLSPQSGDLDVTVDELIPMLDENGVDRALCWLKPPYTRYLEDANRAVYEAQQRYPDRIIGFGWANPRLGTSAALDAVKQCLEEYGFPGVKLNGAQENYFIDDEKISLPVIEKVAQHGAVLAFHVGADAFERTHPFRVAKIADRFPETRILMVHMGGAGKVHLHEAAIEFATQHENLYLIGSDAESKAILKAIAVLGADRVCYGSDTPFGLMRVELARYEALLRDSTPEERRLVMGGSIAAILGL